MTHERFACRDDGAAYELRRHGRWWFVWATDAAVAARGGAALDLADLMSHVVSKATSIETARELLGLAGFLRK